ncbi:MAG: hypothetical protein J6S85_19935 [Methanobrevibacter sp.]|nr:hypothetical protein [Methanobrevibacter sp.]
MLYDIDSIKAILGVSKQNLALIMPKYFEPKKCDGTYKYLLTKNELEELSIRTNCYEQFLSYLEAEENEAKTTALSSSEEAHPLVTDKRWLKLTEFPNVEVEDFEI